MKKACFHCQRTEAEHIKERDPDCWCHTEDDGGVDDDHECDEIDVACPKGFLENEGAITTCNIALEAANARIKDLEAASAQWQKVGENLREQLRVTTHKLAYAEKQCEILDRFLTMMEATVALGCANKTQEAKGWASPPQAGSGFWGKV